jgi:hypothetical protein
MHSGRGRSLAPAAVLGQQNGRQRRARAAGFLQLREDVLLLQLALVVGLAESAEQVGGLTEARGVEVGPALSEPGGRLAIDHEDPPQDAVLAHQVLGRRDPLGAFRLARSALAAAAAGERQARGQSAAGGSKRSRTAGSRELSSQFRRWPIACIRPARLGANPRTAAFDMFVKFA